MADPACNAEVIKKVLSLQAGGNNPKAVADLLGLSPSQVQDIYDSQQSKDLQTPSLPPVGAVNPNFVSFDTELVYCDRPSVRISGAIAGLLLVVGSPWIWYSLGKPPALGVTVMALTFPISIGIWMILRTRFRLSLGRQSVLLRETLFSASLRYSEIAAIRFERHILYSRNGPCPGRRLCMVPRNRGLGNLTVFIPDAQPLPEAMLRRMRVLAEFTGSPEFAART